MLSCTLATGILRPPSSSSARDDWDAFPNASWTLSPSERPRFQKQIFPFSPPVMSVRDLQRLLIKLDTPHNVLMPQPTRREESSELPRLGPDACALLGRLAHDERRGHAEQRKVVICVALPKTEAVLWLLRVRERVQLQRPTRVRRERAIQPTAEPLRPGR